MESKNMNFIESPNLPVKPVTAAIVDGRIPSLMETALMDRGVKLFKTKPLPGIYNAIAYHPDIMLHHLGGRDLLYAPGVDEEFLESLRKMGMCLMEGKTELTARYPGNIAYNICRIGNTAIHNQNYTDPILRRELEKRGVQIVHVKQGYAKCSISVVDSHSIITADAGIAKALEKHGIEALFIEPEKGIRLHELEYGFIGGSTGCLDGKTWAIAGNLKHLNAANQINEFLTRKGKDILGLYDGPVMDIGSILPLME